MRLSTSTNICAFTATRERLPIDFAVELCAAAGYRTLDVNWCMAMNPDSPLRGGDWRREVGRIGELAASRGIVFSQSHLPYDVRASADAALTDALIDRCIEASRMLGVRWAVLHPAVPRDASAFVGDNLARLAQPVETARRAGVGLALENIEEPPPGATRNAPDDSIARLIALVDAINDPMVGACYDFGHAHLYGDDHRARLNALGARVKALHVHDNHGMADEHLLPFFGTIDWVSAMAGLRDIGYANDLTFEIQEFGRYLPKDMRHLAVEQSFAVGQRLLEYARGRVFA